MKYFVVGDIHGCIRQLNKLLNEWSPEKGRLVFLGDYVDRGEDSLAVIQTVQQYVHEHGAIALGGNHEQLFLDWLEDPVEADVFVMNGGVQTIDSFLQNRGLSWSNKEVTEAIQEEFSSEIAFLRSLPNYFEDEHHVFVHAGVDFRLDDWRAGSDNSFRWIREEFYHRPNTSGKTIVFGHTPTCNIHPGRLNCDIWRSPCDSKIGIDGGAVFGGFLHGIVIENGQLQQVYSISSSLECIYRQVESSSTNISE